MYEDLPKVIPSNITGRCGVTILQKFIENKGWFFRRQSESEMDFGIDAEIELTNDNQITGNLFKAQIKASQSIFWKSEEVTVQVRTTSFNLWKKMPLLTILFLVDCSTENVFWTPALMHHPRPDSTTLNIKFDKTRNFSLRGMQELESYLSSWFASFNTLSFQHEVPFYHNAFKEFDKIIDLYDDWCVMDKERLSEFHRFYNYVLRLRLHMGFYNQGIPAIKDWHLRDEGLWDGGCDEFYWATFSEAMRIIKPYYQEAFNRLVERLGKIPMDYENQVIKRFFSSLKDENSIETNTYFSISFSELQQTEFHAKLEQRLEAIGGLRYRFSEKGNKSR